MTDLRSEIETLIRSVAQRAKEANTPFPETIDATKAVAALYAILLKDKPAADPEDDATIAGFQAIIEATSDVPVPIRGRRGHQPS